jgi:hypothetical protein
MPRTKQTIEIGEGDLRRLSDQKTVFDHARELKAQVASAPVKDARKARDVLGGVHEVHRLLDESAFYPEHGARTETKEYKAVHDLLTGKKDLPCLVCGVRKSTLKDKKQNPYGAKQMETHHHIVEWALANAVDVAKFNKSIRPNLAHKHPDNPIYRQPMTAKQVADWVDHSSDNLWVLCDVHHRAKYFGIHEISYPIWAPMDLLNDNFAAYVRAQLLDAAVKNAHKAAARLNKAKAATERVKPAASARR